MGKKKNKKNAEIAAPVVETQLPSRKIIYEEGYVDGTKTVLYRYDGKLKMAGSVKMSNGQMCEFESLPIEFIHNLVEKYYRENQEKYLKTVKKDNFEFYFQVDEDGDKKSLFESECEDDI